MSTVGLYVDNAFYQETTEDIRELQEALRVLEINIPLIATIDPEIGNITAHQALQIQTIDAGTTISTAQWDYLGNMDQSVATTDSVVFGELTIDQINIDNGVITFSGGESSNCIVVPEALTDAFTIKTSGEDYLTIDTTLNKINSVKQMNIVNTTNSTSSTTGSLIVDGGVGIAQDTFINGLTRVTNGTSSSSTVTGALVITGGVGISENLYIGGSLVSNSIDNTPIGGTTPSSGVFTMVTVDNIKIDGNTISSLSDGITLSSINDTLSFDGNIYGENVNDPALPTYSFTGDIDTGMFTPGSNQLAFSTGGLTRFTITSDGYLRGSSNGVVTTPTYSFSTDTDTGIYRIGSDNIGITTGGVNRLGVSNTNLDILVPTINTSNQDTVLEIAQDSETALTIKETGSDPLLVFDTVNNALDISSLNTSINLIPERTWALRIFADADEYMRFNTDLEKIIIWKDLFINTDTINTTNQDTNIVIKDTSVESLTIETGSLEYIKFDTDNEKIIMKQLLELENNIDMQPQATDIYLHNNDSTSLEIWDGDNITGSRMMVFDTTADSITADVPLHFNENIYGDNVDDPLLPTYSFTGDTDTGMYRSGANKISFATEGVKKMTIRNNGIDFFANIKVRSQTRIDMVNDETDSLIIQNDVGSDNYTRYDTLNEKVIFDKTICANAGVVPFTGAHISKNDDVIENGLILSSDSSNTRYNTIINSDIYTKISDGYKDKKVIGVSYNSNNQLQIVSVGEGGIIVCSEIIDDIIQTPISGGDYICSYFDGYGTVQDDDILHSYTVAKSLQDYDFRENYTEFTKDDKKYRKGFIAVSFHCG
jgi:hypothetical protein